MRAMQRLKEFAKSERGSAYVMAAAAMPLLLGSAGYGVDTIQLTVMKRQMQRAADSSATAGAYGVAQAPSTTEEKAYAGAAVARDIAKNKTPPLFGAPTIVTGPVGAFQKTVTVALEARPRFTFMSLFTKSTTRVSATATAALVDGGRFCVLSLYEDDDVPGIEATGNAQFDLGCGMATNARGRPAVTAGGSSLVNASPVMAVGSLTSSSNYAAGTQLQPHSAEQQDPFASLPMPSPTGSCPALEVKKNDPAITIGGTEAQPACYSSIDVKGTLVVNGPVIVYGGNLNFGAGSIVTGTNTTFFLTGPGGAAGTYDTDGHPTLNLTAPTTGTYKGVLFYRDRRAAETTIKLNGDAQSIFSGALYFPTANVELNGNGDFRVRCFQLVGLRLKFSGNSRVINSCPENGGVNPTFRLQFVRLVR